VGQGHGILSQFTYPHYRENHRLSKEIYCPSGRIHYDFHRNSPFRPRKAASPIHLVVKKTDKKTAMKNITHLFLALFSLIMLSACANTFYGVGQDIENMGRGIKDANETGQQQ